VTPPPLNDGYLGFGAKRGLFPPTQISRKTLVPPEDGIVSPLKITPIELSLVKAPPSDSETPLLVRIPGRELRIRYRLTNIDTVYLLVP